MTENLQKIQDNLNLLLQNHALKPELNAGLMKQSGKKLRNSEKSTLQVPLFTERGHQVAMSFMQRLWARRTAE